MSSAGTDPQSVVVHWVPRFSAWMAAVPLLLLLQLQAPCASTDGDDESANGVVSQVTRWEFFQPVEIPDEGEVKWADLILGPQVFTHARADLGDLRLFDSSHQSLPYALRVLRPTSRHESFAAEQYNRSISPDNARELTLDLNRADIEHNQIKISTRGTNFRRRVELEGSEDGQNWSMLADTSLLRFHRGKQRIDVDTVSYPTSRFRHLRIRVFPDPLDSSDPVDIVGVNVTKRVEVPGEILTLPATVGERRPVRTDGRPGSAWIIDLGGDRVPCEKIEVEIDDVEFARNYHVEAIGSAGPHARFERVQLTSDNVWKHRAGEPKRPMVATFQEIRASKLKLVVADFGNPPLMIRSVRFSAPARQVVFDRPDPSQIPLRLFFGNPQAQPPNYDFARNLPDRLPVEPQRADTGPRKRNPSFVPPAQPLTERWPWLIYVVLGAVSLVLLLIIVSLARTAIAIHDRRQNVPSSS